MNLEPTVGAAGEDRRNLYSPVRSFNVDWLIYPLRLNQAIIMNSSGREREFAARESYGVVLCGVDCGGPKVLRVHHRKWSGNVEFVINTRVGSRRGRRRRLVRRRLWDAGSCYDAGSI